MKKTILSAFLIIGILLPNTVLAKKNSKPIYTYSINNAPIGFVTGDLTLYKGNNYKLRKGDKIKLLAVYDSILRIKVIKSSNSRVIGKIGFIGDYNNNFNINRNNHKKNLSKSKFRLKINAPQGAKIQILNITPEYKSNIKLTAGKYDIKVSKNGYKPYRKRINLYKNTTLNISLQKFTKRELKSQIFTNGKIEWNSRFKNSYPKHINGLYWEDDSSSTVNETYNQGKIQCKELGNNFRMPTIHELKKIKGYMYNFDYRYSDVRFMTFWSSSIMPKDSGDQLQTWDYNIYRGSKSRTYLTDLRQTRCVRKKNRIDRLDVISMAQAYTKKEIRGKKLKLSTKPIPEKIPTLKKGEFEPTIVFNKRVKATKLKIKQDNKIALGNWKRTIIQEKQEYKNTLKDLKENASKMLLKNILRSLHLKYGVPKIISAKYNADKEVFKVVLGSDWWGNYNKKVEVPVKLQYAKKFKAILKDKKFRPTIEFEVIRNKLIFRGIKEIKDPETFVEENEYNKAYKIKNKSKSILELKSFIKKYPNSTFIPSAKSQISYLKAKIFAIKERERLRHETYVIEQKKKEERKARAIRRKQESYNSKKYVGEKVCKDGVTAIILSITITAYVEKVSGNNIQLRISDTEGTSPNMNGVTLYRDTLIWDNYSDWYKCNY